ncbi:MAG: GNAT family N-acetyltransferase [Clostridia bacterium]|nr:GNAT family N-acetyltransferase [Clostridia bacterium]
MFVPFDESILKMKEFMKDEVAFSVFYRIIDGELDTALMSSEKDMIALNNANRSLWLWVSRQLEEETLKLKTDMLARELEFKKIPGVTSFKGTALLFAKTYSALLGISYKLDMDMKAFFCPKISLPARRSGNLIKATMEHLDIVADFTAGFLRDGLHDEVTAESQRIPAAKLINGGNLYLHEADGKIVTMANIAHRASGYARINSVYTSPEERNKGYAGMLVTSLCEEIFNEGLIPVLFTDSSNPASNKVYQRIGFVDCGEIEQYSFIY